MTRFEQDFRNPENLVDSICDNMAHCSHCPLRRYAIDETEDVKIRVGLRTHTVKSVVRCRDFMRNFIGSDVDEEWEVTL